VKKWAVFKRLIVTGKTETFNTVFTAVKILTLILWMVWSLFFLVVLT
jgi:hypothetical protein